MLFANSVQEVMDFALITQAATLRSRVPFLHVLMVSVHRMKWQDRELSEDTIRSFIDEHLIRAHRSRSLSPDRPVMRGTAQNPDVFFNRASAEFLLSGNAGHR